MTMDPSRFQMFYGPEGRMTLVDRALEAVMRGAISIGLRFPRYAVLASMVKPTRKLMKPSDKVFIVDDHVGVTGSGYISDLYRIVDHMRIEAQRHRLLFDAAVDVGTLVDSVSGYFHGYTLYPVRPQGVAVIIGGVDKLGVQLYQVDPSGTAFNGDAFALGVNSDKAIDILENEYRPDMSLDEALNLITSVVERTGNPEPTIQVGYISLDNPVFRRETLNGRNKIYLIFL
ncbi:20S proteasome alpha subunit [Candidatus Caldarchaeum subterraneum]|uniref:20S proteasome alpha subunit n=1 Tax=Caldiarchaeum subterraneum TaxID=311458 RepID=E6N7E6_CALS0|nr:20S proteasome alpha subunit [Candidatus Caldarchaeum subterraneum]BAJ51000.1 20S proteasome alpha subunit [Candidatus Caldarchaeum subterraneum]